MTIVDDGLLERLKNGAELQKIADSLVLSGELDAVICRLWPRGFNTVDIARYAKVEESKVANRLAFLRDSGAL